MSQFTKLELPSLANKPTVLAIDGAINKNGIAVSCNGHVDTSVLLSDKTLKGAERLLDLGNKLNSILDTYNPKFAVVEGYSFGSIGRTFSISEAGGVYRYILAQRNIPIFEIPPTTLKKYITGDGRADKKKMAKIVKSLFNLEFKTSDETDAFCLLVAGLDYLETPLVEDTESFRDYLMKSCKVIYGEHPETIKLKT